MSLSPAARAGLAALELLPTLAEGTELSDDQRATLSGWTGWGPLAPAFAKTPTDDWAGTADRLEEILSPGDHLRATEVCDTSYFTPAAVAEAAYTLLLQTGFAGGRVLEPGCGSGAIMSAAPAHLPITWTGVDMDPTSVKIARLMNPAATVIESKLERTHFPSHSFDAVIGNVPFSQSGVYDPSFPDAPNSLHGYFTARALDALKPGGYAAIITSRHFLDSITSVSDSLFQPERTQLVAAVRLPAGTFDGTQVVADILLIRKPLELNDAAPGVGLPTHVVERTRQTSNRFSGTSSQTVTISEHRRVPVPHEDPAHEVLVSALWEEHPELVAGEMVTTGYSPAPLTVKAADRSQAIRDAIDAACRLYSPEAQPLAGTLRTLDDVVLADAEGRKEGSFHVVGRAMHQVKSCELIPVPRASQELTALVELRDAVAELLALEADLDLLDDEITPARVRARALYESYAAKFGALGRGTLTEGKPDPDTGAPTYSWRRPTLGGFRKDPDYFTVLAAEEFDQETGTASPAAILLRRVNRAPEAITATDSPAEAARLAAGPGGVVDLHRTAQLLGVDENAATVQITPHAYLDEDGRWILASDYLSGNIRMKLAAARAAGIDRSVAALETVMPEQLGPLDIRVQLGVPWISSSYVAKFMNDVLKTSGRIAYTPSISTWEIISASTSHHVATNATYGTPDIAPSRLLELALNNAHPVIYDEIWEDGRAKRVKNSGKTIAAEEKQTAIADRFEVWLWEDQDRANEVCTEFNRRFRSHLPRTGHGAHLTFPGLSDGITLWDHQRNAVDRIISGQRTILHHTVGAGKTLEMLVGAVKLKQLGLAQKPLITVPNHLLEQIAREARTAYPTGRFLVAGREEVTKDAKRLFAARCATGEWDAVIMTHTAFTSIPVATELEECWIEEQKAELSSAASSMERWDRPRSQKKIAAAKRRLEAQLQKLRADARRDPDTITFEQLGIDHIAVDELHFFRRLMVTATSQSGFSLGHSKRATDLALKIRSLSDRHPSKPIFAGFTGTLISNSLAEIFVWQTLTQPDRLAEAGVDGFDAWAATFVKFETAVEVKPTGQGFQMKRRPRSIRNAAELATMLSETCDTVTAEQIGLERPTSAVHDVVSEPTLEQKDAVSALSDRADLIYGGMVSQDVDNMLAICGEGRAIALDPELVRVPGGSPTMVDAADTISRLHHQNVDRLFGNSPAPGMLQLVLCDLGTPKPGDASSYGRLRKLLADRGVPADRVRFVHEATTDKARAALFAQCRAGDVSVLIGSTSKVGVGTNIQTRLGAIHHLDAPWTPAEVEQREGRAIRPKNFSGHVDIFRYVTEGTFDALSWETLERKAKAVAGFLSAAADAREIDDITDTALSYGQVKALATGQPELLRLAEVSNDIRKLRLLHAVWVQQVNAATGRLSQLEAQSRARLERSKLLVQASNRGLQSDPGGLERLAAAAIELYRAKSKSYLYSVTPRYTVFGFEAAAEWHSAERRMELRLFVRHSRVETFPIKAKQLRRGPAHLARHFAELISVFDADLVSLTEALNSSVASAKAELAELNEFIDTAAFDREEELRTLTAEQGRIHQRLAEAADPVRDREMAAA